MEVHCEHLQANNQAKDVYDHQITHSLITLKITSTIKKEENKPYRGGRTVSASAQNMNT